MEFAKLQKSPEFILEETLENLSGSFASLTSSTKAFSVSIKELYGEGNDNQQIQNKKVKEQLDNLKEETKSDLVAHHHDTIAECDNLASNIQNLFSHYRFPYAEWCVHESRLQKRTEEYKSHIDGILFIHEELLNKTKKRVEMLTKIIDTEMTIKEFEVKDPCHHEDDLSIYNRSACDHYSIVFVQMVTFVPRQIHRFLRYLSTKMRCASPPQRSSSHETLVVKKKKNSVAERTAAKDLKQSEERMKQLTTDFLSSLEDVLNGFKDTANGISYIHQDLCRLDYVEANKEKHYEIMGGKYEQVTKDCRTYVTSLVALRSSIAETLSLNINISSDE